jgi:endonuclease G, mitochondrial
MMPSDSNQPKKSPLSYFRTLLSNKPGAAAARTEGLESTFATQPEPDLSADGIKDRMKTAKRHLRSYVEKYMNNDPNLIALVDEVVKNGGDGLRMVADNNEALGNAPQAMEGLEVIVRTDGTRPSFLVKNGKIDKASSVIGSWDTLLTENEVKLREAFECVGRIDVPGTSVGFVGTGYLIHRDVIVTNRHVLQAAAFQLSNGTWQFANNAAIDFGHELQGQASVNRRKLKQVIFFAPQTIIDPIDHNKLDLVLIELEPADDDDVPDKLPVLDLTNSWMLPSREVCTIGYPGAPRPGTYPPTLIEQLFQTTFGHKRMAPGILMQPVSNVANWTLAHDATTLGGNSGSMIMTFGPQGSAVGLHYGGRLTEPRENWGHILGNVLDAKDTTNTTLRDCLARYGIGTAQPAAIPSWNPNPEAPTVIPPVGRPVSVVSPGQGNLSSPTQMVVTLQMMRPITSIAGANRLESADLEAAGDGETPASQLADRQGYDPDFMNGWSIPLPQPSSDMRNLRRGGTGVELKYEHFSVIQSASRRMPIITATNIDGAESRRLPRIQKWSYDGRLNQDDQWGNELYQNNDLDRGHMVRREDPVWGSLTTARRANVDTFHYTNSCPQIAGVNQQIWLGLEDYILSHTREDNMRVSVFTGPYFSGQDMEYRGALIPRAFWKIIAFQLDDGRPSATAYEVSQARELEELEFVFAGYKTFQISIQQVMDATKIDFSALIPFDGFSQHERVHNQPIAERLDSFTQIRV